MKSERRKHVPAPSAAEVQRRLRALGSPRAAAAAARFFKTGPGQYGEGDVFLGIRAEPMYKLAREFYALPMPEVQLLIRSPIHEDRMLAVLVLRDRFAKGDQQVRKHVCDFYFSHTRFVNNWDLVDASARDIVGAYLENRSREPLYRLARSKSLCERRIAIVATHHFIRLGDFADTFKIAEMLLDDDEDLIHKATGWMLREVGKRDQKELERFLKRNHACLPRTALRYAIERFPPAKRRAYLKGLV